MAPKRQNGAIATLLEKKQQSGNEDILKGEQSTPGVRIPQGGSSTGCDSSGVTSPGSSSTPPPIFLEEKVFRGHCKVPVAKGEENLGQEAWCQGKSIALFPSKPVSLNSELGRAVIS